MNSNDTQVERLLLSSKEVAQMLGISERTLFTMTKDGRIDCVRIGSAKRYSREQVDAFIARSTDSTHSSKPR